MKVLWFTNNAVSLNPNTLSGGWMQCLEKYLSASSDIQLFIATRAKTVRAQVKLLLGRQSTIQYLTIEL
jgi:hypothetical protein